MFWLKSIDVNQKHNFFENIILVMNCLDEIYYHLLTSFATWKLFCDIATIILFLFTQFWISENVDHLLNDSEEVNIFCECYSTTLLKFE